MDSLHKQHKKGLVLILNDTSLCYIYTQNSSACFYTIQQVPCFYTIQQVQPYSTTYTITALDLYRKISIIVISYKLVQMNHMKGWRRATAVFQLLGNTSCGTLERAESEIFFITASWQHNKRLEWKRRLQVKNKGAHFCVIYLSVWCLLSWDGCLRHMCGRVGPL